MGKFTKFTMQHTEESLIEWARLNRKNLCKEFFQRKQLLPTTENITVFMTGSP